MIILKLFFTRIKENKMSQDSHHKMHGDRKRLLQRFQMSESLVFVNKINWMKTGIYLRR